MIKELKTQVFSFELPTLDTLVIVCYDHNTDHASLLEGLDNKLSKAGFVKEVIGYAKLIVHYLDIDEMNSRLSGEPIEKSIVHNYVISLKEYVEITKLMMMSFLHI